MEVLVSQGRSRQRGLCPRKGGLLATSPETIQGRQLLSLGPDRSGGGVLRAVDMSQPPGFLSTRDFTVCLTIRQAYAKWAAQSPAGKCPRGTRL